MSNMPSVKVMLLGVDARKSAIFSMAFKMHSATNYQLAESNTQADILVVDVDGMGGEQLWEKACAQYAGIPKVYSSIMEPKFDVAYLPKPIKIETLFPVLRAALSGLVTFKATDSGEQGSGRDRLSFKQQAKDYKNTLSDEPVATMAPRDVRFPVEQLQLFDAHQGLLGTLRQAAKQAENVALIVENKPILMYFADIERVLLAVAPSRLEQICQDANVVIQVKKIGDHPEWKQHAKAQMDSCLWQFAIWTSQGRLPNDLNVNQPISLHSWPNITRLAYIPDAMRLSAFLTKSPVSLPMTYKMIRVELTDLLNFISACHVTNLIRMTSATPVGAAASVTVGLGSQGQQQTAHTTAPHSASQQASESENQATQTAPVAPPARPKQQPSSMLQRLLKKLTGK